METKLKFKVGDKVRVKSLEWYNQGFTITEDFSFTGEMSLLCGKIVTIDEIREKYYILKESDYYWQDWMLEDEVVTEEKQEEEQLNKKDMETKEMTNTEVLEYLKDTKILCTSTEETIKIQVKLFTFGIKWISKIEGIREDKYLLFINRKLEIQHTSDIEDWMNDVNKRIDPSEILAIRIKEEEKPKFDPKSLRPFDKVLVKNDTIWYARFFDMRGEYDYKTTSGEAWIDCIPYNEDTKFLHGTTNEAPEFYRI